MDTPGAKTTLEACELWRKPVLLVCVTKVIDVKSATSEQDCCGN
jgi:hypothetical protein